MANVADIFETMDYGPAPEAADTVKAWLAARSGAFGFFINGAWTEPRRPSQTIVSHNPATGEKLATLGVAGKEDIDAAVDAAAAAFEAWSKRGGHARARVLYALARLIQKNSRFLAVLETLDNGKPIRETRDIDIPLAARHFYYHAGWAQLMERELPDYEALGVVGQIIPWNFPFLMLAWKIAPAIAAGNCVVLKPAEYTSLTALYFAELCEEAGVPPGVINIVTGAGETGGLIVDHPGIAKIAFTGSTDVGRLIRERTAGSGKKLTLELGGKSAFIVCDDADLDAAVEGLVDAIWFNQGQVCCAGSRLLVEESVSGRFIAMIKRRLETFRIGDPLDKCIDMGAIVDPVQHRRIANLVRQSVEQGAKLWQPQIPCPDKGCFYLPTLLTDVAPANVAMLEEIFGPVLAATTFRTTSEAIALANNSRYGLSATVWSQNIGRAIEIANEMKAGVVWVNTTNQFDASSGFGGYRESGFGREGGLEGFYEYLKPESEWLKEGAVVLTTPAENKTRKAPDAIDRSAKHYIGGKQVRPDDGASVPVLTHNGTFAGRVAHGSRKDIRDAVEAAFAAAAWSKTTAHNRAQILFYIAENLSVREDEFARRIVDLTGVGAKKARTEVEASIARLFTYAAWADKFEGPVHAPPQRSLALAVNEPIGVIGIACPDPLPLLALISLVAPAIAMGNRCIVVPSERYPLVATDFYQVIETSDVPAGVINIVTGPRDELAQVLAKHDQVEALWYHGTPEGSSKIEALSAANLKRTWVNHGKARDWLSPTRGEGRQFLREVCQVKNIWLTYGD
jgi:aldehyde dehydrogenase (NAD+)